MARQRTAPSTRTTVPTAQSTRQALKEKTNTSRVKGALYEDDGNTENLVRNAKTRLGSLRNAMQTTDEMVMAGGLGDPATTDELAKSDRPPAPAARANRRPPRMNQKIVPTEAQSKVMSGLKKRMDATARKEAGKNVYQPETIESTAETSSNHLPTQAPVVTHQNDHITDDSDLSLSLSSPPATQLSVARRSRTSLIPPGSALRSHGTPAIESSILALKNFKRRPRQPSMLQIVRQRTGGGQASVINTEVHDESNMSDLASATASDEEDFSPEAEGTPLQKNKTRTRASLGARKVTNDPTQLVTASEALSNKRKSSDLDKSSTALESLKSKRQKPIQLEEDVAIQKIGSRSQKKKTRSSSARETTPQTTSDILVENSQPSSTPLTDREVPVPDFIIPSTEQELPYDEPELNETMAEPASSSPTPHDTRADQAYADELADPVTQVSPRPTRKKSQPPPKPMSTAKLQSLLPKRRKPVRHRPRKGEYDLSDEEEQSSDVSLEESEDELSGRSRRRRPAATNSRKAPAKSPKAKSTQTKRKPPAPATGKPAASTKQPAKTYGRAAARESDRENFIAESEDKENDSSTLTHEMSMYEAVKSRELEEAKRKFADVDDWDMEFESMSQEDHRSSSQLWR
ncbi:Hypothetical protein R9X50_00236100 [Acrodontium crateriforme]|uniref:Uncharacterized protein n=1 Tax=Acrodontium crateriforme TaxID=150365 RepID=A0AAQ3M103_9PEZI|nr:Hypothetical protein R9X50_00236100 [Acrodontium crateriforme]